MRSSRYSQTGQRPSDQQSADDANKSLCDTFASLLISFNRSLNLISKQTEGEVWQRHIEHCLTLKRHAFPAGAVVVDWGTGGGLPAIPLAIAFPDVQFIAVDAVGKKIQAVRAMVRRLGLNNLETWHGRAEEWPGRTHYSVSRATASLETLWTWHRRAAQPLAELPENCWKPGLICLKGGDLSDEIAALTNLEPSVTIDLHLLDTNPPTDVSAAKYIVHVYKPDSTLPDVGSSSTTT